MEPIEELYLKLDNLGAYCNGLRDELVLIKGVLDRANEANRLLVRENEHLRSVLEGNIVSKG